MLTVKYFHGFRWNENRLLRSGTLRWLFKYLLFHYKRQPGKPLRHMPHVRGDTLYSARFSFIGECIISWWSRRSPIQTIFRLFSAAPPSAMLLKWQCYIYPNQFTATRMARNVAASAQYRAVQLIRADMGRECHDDFESRMRISRWYRLAAMGRRYDAFFDGNMIDISRVDGTACMMEGSSRVAITWISRLHDFQ